MNTELADLSEVAKPGVELIMLPTGDQAPKILLEALREVSFGLRTYIKSLVKTVTEQVLCLAGSWAPSLAPFQQADCKFVGRPQASHSGARRGVWF